MFVITREINEYDQDGEYFVAVKSTPWTLKELQDEFGDVVGLHLSTGGGRQGIEHTWYNMYEVKDGEL